MEDLSTYNPEGSDLRRMQLKMLDMLIVLDKICQKHGIVYWLSSGTLLGAHRHQGFIPWDDDLDVQVCQKDYKRLMSILKNELPSDLKIQTRETDRNYWYYWSKIRDTKSLVYEPDSSGYHYNGIFLDIFPFEPVISFPLKKKMDSIRYLVERRKFLKESGETCRGYGLMCFYPLALLHTAITRLIFRFFKARKYSYCAGIGFFSEVQKAADIFPVGKILFEGKEFNAPHRVDRFLASAFGSDYMQLPPVSARRTHISQITFLEKEIQ